MSISSIMVMILIDSWVMVRFGVEKWVKLSVMIRFIMFSSIRVVKWLWWNMVVRMVYRIRIFVLIVVVGLIGFRLFLLINMLRFVNGVVVMVMILRISSRV